MDRVSIVSTPRSGNTWLRRMLATLYGLEERGADAHAAPQLDWANLPARCVLQAHARATPEFRAGLAGAGFAVVVLSRHPFDVLCSTLQFVRHAHKPEACDRVARGRRCEICPIVGAAPLDRRFLEDYALGADGVDLLSVSPSWWPHAGIIQVRYEDLVADPVAQLERLAGKLGPMDRARIDETVANNTMDGLRAYFPQWKHHFWKGQSGHWRAYFPQAEARRLAAHHRGVLDMLGYDCNPDPGLTPEQARENWRTATAAT
jgi:hypothetical protein